MLCIVLSLVVVYHGFPMISSPVILSHMWLLLSFLQSFLALARERGQTRGDTHLLDLLVRLDYNGYYSQQ